MTSDLPPRDPAPQPNRPTQAVILAGGQGARLRPYTDDRPKPMVEIPGTGSPVLGHQLAWLAAEGVTDAVLACGHRAEVVQEWLDATELPLRVSVVVEQEPLGRGGGLRYAAASLPRPDEPWYAANGDVWTRFPLRDMADFHAERDATATLALARPRMPWGAVETDAFGHVLDFVEAPPSPYLVNAGVYVFSAAFTALLPVRGDHERTTFPRLARERALAGYPLPQGASWRAIDTAKDLMAAARDLGGEP